MDQTFMNRMEDRLQHERRALVAEASKRQKRSAQLPGDIQPEREEQAQTEITSGITEMLDERQQDRISDIDAALARIEAGNYGRCQNCARIVGPQTREKTARL